MTKKKHDPLEQATADEAAQRQQAAERAEDAQARANPIRRGFNQAGKGGPPKTTQKK